MGSNIPLLFFATTLFLFGAAFLLPETLKNVNWWGVEARVYSGKVVERYSDRLNNDYRLLLEAENAKGWVSVNKHFYYRFRVGRPIRVRGKIGKFCRKFMVVEIVSR